jgi:membrane protein
MPGWKSTILFDSMTKKKVTAYSFFKQVITEFINDNALKYSAALSYYTIFSFPSILIIVISIFGMLLGREAIEGELYNQLYGLIGSEAASQIQNILKNIHLSRERPAAFIISIISLFIGATGIFGEIQDSLNKIWGLKTKTNKIWWKLILNRLISFALIASLGFVLLVSLGLNAIIASISKHLIFLSQGEIAFKITETLVSFFISSIFFAIIFKFLPDAKIKWKDVMIGSFLTALLFYAGKAVIGYYLGQSNLSSIYGAAGSVMVIMVWAYYSSAILFLGAEFTKVYANDFGHKILPNNYSEWIKVEEITVKELTLSDETKL